MRPNGYFDSTAYRNVYFISIKAVLMMKFLVGSIEL